MSMPDPNARNNMEDVICLSSAWCTFIRLKAERAREDKECTFIK